MAKPTGMSVTAVPRSGCRATSRSGTAVSAPAMARSSRVIAPRRLSPKNFASTSASAALAAGRVPGFIGVRFGAWDVAGAVRIGEVELHILRRGRRRQRFAGLLRVERRQDMARHAGGVGTVDAVLEEHHAGNLRVVAR